MTAQILPAESEFTRGKSGVCLLPLVRSDISRPTMDTPLPSSEATKPEDMLKEGSSIPLHCPIEVTYFGGGGGKKKKPKEKKRENQISRP